MGKNITMGGSVLSALVLWVPLGDGGSGKKGITLTFQRYAILHAKKTIGSLKVRKLQV